MERHYELTYDLPGPSGGHRADPRSFPYPEHDTDESGSLTNEAVTAMADAQKDLDEYVHWLVLERGAHHVRLRSDDLELNLPVEE